MNAEPSFPVEAETTARAPFLTTWLRKRRWFILLVIVPTIMAAVYFSLFATDVYVSESRFVVKSPDQKHSQISSLANIIQTTGLSSGQEQTNEVLAFIRSRDALHELEKHPGVRERFGSPSADFFSRFPQPFSNDSFEDLYAFYGKMVGASVDSETGTAILNVKAYSAEDAYRINRRLLELSEGMINRLNTRAQANGVAEAQKQVDLAAARTRAARVALAEYRNAQALVDPDKQAEGVLDITNNMIAQRAALQAHLDLMRSLTPRNPSIPALKDRISAISAQIASQDSRVVGTTTGIASKMGNYENLVVEQEFATENLNAANAALVQARADAHKQQFYLERVVSPNLPDEPSLPKRLLSVLVVAATATCLYFIGWMFLVGILEHAPD